MASQELTGEQYKTLCKALCSAFPAHSDFAQLLMFRFGIDMRTIVADNATTPEVAFRLILWAESEGRLETFVVRAREENAGNQDLERAARDLGWYRAPPPDNHPVSSGTPRSPASGHDATARNVPLAGMPLDNPFFSEFGTGRLRRFLEARRTRYLAPLVVALFAVVAVVFAHLSGAACMRVTFARVGSTDTKPIVFGFVGELSHGPFYLLLLPAFVFLGFRFLEVAHSTLAQLSEGQMLLLDRTGARVRDVHPLTYIDHLNRRWSRYVGGGAMLFCVSVMATQEISGYSHTAFGWVQAAKLHEPEGRVRVVQDMVARHETGPLASVEELCGKTPQCRVVVQSVQGGAESARQQTLMIPFLAFGLGVQAFLSIFGMWIAGKVLLVLGVLLLAMRRAQAAPLRGAFYREHADLIAQGANGWTTPKLCFRLDLRDRFNRLGLTAVDSVYLGSLWLAIVIAGWRFLLVMSNRPKGTNLGMAGMAGAPHLFSQLIVVVMIVVVLLGTFVVPVILFDVLTQKLRAVAVKKLTVLAAAAPEHHSAEELSLARDLAIRQNPSRIQNPTFRVLVFFVGPALLLSPLALGLPAHGGRLQSPMNFFAYDIPDCLCPARSGSSATASCDVKGTPAETP